MRFRLRVNSGFLFFTFIFSAIFDVGFIAAQERTLLQDFATGEIVAEYRQRLNLILEDVDQVDTELREVMSNLASKDSADWKTQGVETMTELLLNVRSSAIDLLPYARANDFEAQEVVAIRMFIALEDDTSCEAAKFAINAAKRGSYLAAVALQMKYRELAYFAVGNVNPEHVRKHQLWTLELAHRDPFYHYRRDQLFSELGEEKSDILIREWMNWTALIAETNDLLEECSPD